ncbi:MAG: hypothetical protein WBF55_11535 [Syntrophobacteria bacterium]
MSRLIAKEIDSKEVAQGEVVEQRALDLGSCQFGPGKMGIS